MNRIQAKMSARYGHRVCGQPHSTFPGWYCALPVDTAGNHLKTSWCLCVYVGTDDLPPTNGAPALSLLTPEDTMNDKNENQKPIAKKERGFARAQRRLQESAKAGRLQLVAAQQAAVKRLQKKPA